MKTLPIALGLLACAALAGCGSYVLTEQQRQTAEIGARDFADRSGGRFVSCSGQDSDGDGYVTCAIQTAAAASEDIVCAYASRGCKRKD